MSDDKHMTVELRLAKAYREEGEQLRKEAAADLEAARYERGQAEHAKRLIEQTEKLLTEREQRLLQLGEPQLVAREQEADAKLKQAQQLMAEYSNTKHEAAAALVAINKREAAAARQVG
jgi:hypothetical protein